MSHFAEINNDGIVQNVIVAEQDFIDSGAVGDSSNWIQTSYNTRGGIHYAPNSIESDGGIALRKNYAGIGYTYDSAKNVFISPKPFPSWSLDASNDWQAPVTYPNDVEENSLEVFITWDEDNTQWLGRTLTGGGDETKYRWDASGLSWIAL